MKGEKPIKKAAWESGFGIGFEKLNF